MLLLVKRGVTWSFTVNLGLPKAKGGTGQPLGSAQLSSSW